jgi:hypothetical protein
MMATAIFMTLALPALTYFGIHTAYNLNEGEYYTRSTDYPSMNYVTYILMNVAVGLRGEGLVMECGILIATSSGLKMNHRLGPVLDSTNSE